MEDRGGGSPRMCRPAGPVRPDLTCPLQTV